MVDLGPHILRPIGEFFMLPVFRAVHSVIGNWGLVIIVFSILIRMLLWPLSIPQIKSSRKMQLLQPKIAEIRAQYADDQQRQQMETMKLYREYGVNPVGGCLPLVLQLPILYALWGTLSSVIDLRQAGFIFWIRDLSIPDVVLNLPFTIPLLGDKLAGLALLMGTTLFIQQKMMITDPKQKAMVYVFPLLLMLTFNHLPSGLNLYYLTFNLLSIGQQIYMTKYSKNSLTLEDMRREAGGKKKSWFAQKMEDAQKMADVQKGMSAKSNGTTRTPKKKT
jgi:YidC/Oxa1 family membrane protein insertase